MLNGLISLVALLTVFGVIQAFVSRHEQREEKEKQAAFDRHRAETPYAVRASLARQSDLRKSEFARLRKERREANVETAFIVAHWATFPIWYAKDWRDARRAEKYGWNRRGEHEDFGM